MNKTTFPIIVALCFFSTKTLLALEIKDSVIFDLSDYKTPDFIRKGLDGRFDSSTDYISSLSDSKNYGKSDAQNFTSESKLNAAYWRQEETRKKITFFSVGFSPELSVFKNSQGNDMGYEWDSRLTNVKLATPVYWENKHFIKPKIFTIYTINGAYGLERNSARGSGFEELTDYFKQEISIMPKIGLGVGRIENVTDARQMLYIVEALRQNQSLKREFSNDELRELADIIYQVKNKRFLDSRLRKIEELTTVHEYLASHDLLSEADISYFTTLNDIWDFGALFTRKSGHELSFGTQLRYAWDYEKFNKQWSMLNDSLFTSHTLNDELFLNFNYHKSVRLNWQHDLEASAYTSLFSMVNNNNSKGVYTPKQPSYVTTYVNYKLGYYPTTRTNLYLSARNFTSSNLISSSFQNSFQVNVGAYYYISQYLRFGGNFTVAHSYYSIENSKNNNVGTSLSFAINYSIY